MKPLEDRDVMNRWFRRHPRGPKCLPPFCTCAEPVLSQVSYKCHACGSDRVPTESDRRSTGPGR